MIYSKPITAADAAKYAYSRAMDLLKGISLYSKYAPGSEKRPKPDKVAAK